MPKDTSAHALAVIDKPKRPQIFFGDDGQKCGHLFAAVIEQAFRELFIPQSSHDGDREYSRYESIRLLTADYGEWAAHRNWLCTCANIDGDALANNVRQMLLGNQPIALNLGQRREDEAGRGIDGQRGRERWLLGVARRRLGVRHARFDHRQQRGDHANARSSRHCRNAAADEGAATAICPSR